MVAVSDVESASSKILSKIRTGLSYQHRKLEGMCSPPLRYMASVSALGSMENSYSTERAEMDQVSRFAVSQEYLGTCLWTMSQESQALPDLVLEQ